ncbi:MAG: DUF2141 domain-containing protein [Pseudomonadota bacterium]
MSKGLVAIVLAAGFTVACAAPQIAIGEPPPKGTTLQITFSSVAPETGKIWVGVCTEAEMAERYSDEDARCTAERWLDANEGASVSFDGIPAGTYAITAFHDEDDNNQLDFDTRGIPLEATGNGNNAKGFFGPPTFRNMKFQLPPASDSQQPLSFTVELYRVG